MDNIVKKFDKSKRLFILVMNTMAQTTKIDKDQFVRKLYKLFREKPNIFHVKKLKAARGYCHLETERIELDYRDEIISTLLHEALHFIYPELSEELVLKNEHDLINSLSPRQVRNIIKRFGAIL